MIEVDSAQPSSDINVYKVAHSTAYGFTRHPGFYLIREALDSAAQRRLAVDALTRFPAFPATTNLDATIGCSPPGLFQASLHGLYLQEERIETAIRENCGDTMNEGPDAACSQPWWHARSAGPSAVELLRRLRWASLGPPFDWTKRVYVGDAPFFGLPLYLRDIAAGLLVNVREAILRADPAPIDDLPLHFYDPNAAIINYYRAGDTLGGHVDDAERDLEQPLVSLSVGCPAIFLMGGPSKDIQPTAVLLRSGDAVLLTGPARRSYHGVPRILPGTNTMGQAAGEAPSMAATISMYLEQCRINVSVRVTT